MVDFIKKITGTYIDAEEQQVLDALAESGLESRRVVGRGTLTVDPKEVTNTDQFKKYADLAKDVVEHPEGPAIDIVAQKHVIAGG